MIAAFSRQGDVERAVEVLARMGVDENLVIDEAVFQEKRRHGLADVSVVRPVALLSGDGDIDRDLRLAGPGGGNDALIDLIFHRSGQMPVQLQRVGVGKGKTSAGQRRQRIAASAG